MDALAGRLSGRQRTVAEHLRYANAQDLDGLASTFAADAALEDEAAGERHVGRQAVRGYYETLIDGVPDLAIDVRDQREAGDAIVLEAWLSGTHMGMYAGMPGTYRRVLFPMCLILAFDGADDLALARLYYDRATLMRQIGILHP